ESPGLGTVACDEDWRFYYDPAVLAWPLEELSGACLHELKHEILFHAERARAKGVIHDVWNIAADIEINDRLISEGVNLPEWAYNSTKMRFPRGLLAEAYYDLL